MALPCCAGYSPEIEGVLGGSSGLKVGLREKVSRDSDIRSLKDHSQFLWKELWALCHKGDCEQLAIAEQLVP